MFPPIGVLEPSPEGGEKLKGKHQGSPLGSEWTGAAGWRQRGATRRLIAPHPPQKFLGIYPGYIFEC